MLSSADSGLVIKTRFSANRMRTGTIEWTDIERRAFPSSDPSFAWDRSHSQKFACVPWPKQFQPVRIFLCTSVSDRFWSAGKYRGVRALEHTVASGCRTEEDVGHITETFRCVRQIENGNVGRDVAHIMTIHLFQIRLGATQLYDSTRECG